MLSYTLSNAQWVYDVKESKVKKKKKRIKRNGNERTKEIEL